MAGIMGVHISKDVDLASAAAGGALIALSSTALMALLGKVSGMSGVMHSVIVGKNGASTGWRMR